MNVLASVGAARPVTGPQTPNAPLISCVLAPDAPLRGVRLLTPGWGSQPIAQVRSGGSTLAHLGPPRWSVSRIVPMSGSVCRSAVATSLGSIRSSISLARRNMWNPPPSSTLPHVRYERSPRRPCTAGPRKSKAPVGLLVDHHVELPAGLARVPADELARIGPDLDTNVDVGQGAAVRVTESPTWQLETLDHNPHRPPLSRDHGRLDARVKIVCNAMSGWDDLSCNTGRVAGRSSRPGPDQRSLRTPRRVLISQGTRCESSGDVRVRPRGSGGRSGCVVGADRPGVAIRGIGDSKLQFPPEPRFATVPPVPIERSKSVTDLAGIRRPLVGKVRHAATVHHAPNRPIAAPRRRPWAPPLAPAHASQAIACDGAIFASVPDATPRAATAAAAEPSTATISTWPFDEVIHGSIS